MSPVEAGSRRTKTMSALEAGLVALVRTVNQPRLHTELARRSGVFVDRAAYGVLGHLGDAGELRLSDLATRLGVDLSTASRQVRDLERSGLVTRAVDPDDGRASTLALTDEGATALASLRRVRHELLAQVVADWSADDREQLARLLPRFAASLRAAVAED